MRGDDRALAEAAASVADGAPVDWVSAESHADPDNRRLVRHLRLVESIASLHRSIPVHDLDDIDFLPAGMTDTALEPGGAPWGRLSLLDRIGQGTSCEVYRAWDTALHREVALKLLHDEEDHAEAHGRVLTEAHGRVLEEARRLARVRHAHVVQVYGAEQHDGRVGLWMELVRGESLEQTVQTRGTFGAREAALIGLDLCAALAAVHGAGLLHRDIKAQNVMRESGGRLVLMDFGTGEELSGTNRLVGTPLYLAPEIFRGQRASVQSDLYSLGVLLFYLVTGRFPVNAGSMEQLAGAHLRRERQPLRDLRPDLPEGFVSTVERALDSDPVRRFRSVGELEQGLRESLDDPGALPRAERAPAARSRSRRKFGRAFLASAAALVLLVATLIVWSRTSTTLVPPSVARVAVLPFRDLSSDPSTAYLADELTDQLISTLGQIRSLQVPSLTSVLQYRDHAVSVPEIGKRLHVDDVVEATLSVVRGRNGSPDRVRVNARLIAAASDSQIWARSFEGSLGDTLTLQADVARAIAEGVGAALTPSESRRLTQARPTTPAANEAYYEGLHYLSQSGADGHRAVDAFRRATTLDPDHAGAHAGLARGLLTLGFLGASSHQEGRALALSEVNRALALDPDSAEAHAVLADLQFYYDWDWAGADRAYRRAIALNGSFARARSQYARYLAAAGRRDESITEAVRSADLEPMSASAASTRALVLYYARDYSGALAAIGHALQLEPESASAYIVRSRIEAARGSITDAIAANERALDIAADAASNGWRVHLILLQALAGSANQARAALNSFPTELASRRQRVGATQVAFVHAALGDHARAIDLLEQALREREPDLLWLAVDPRADSLRSDPRFVEVLAKVGIRR